MFYGAAIGDSLGILTEFMRPSAAEFYYDQVIKT
jgi:ADP-ribosylglycohydrolase